MSIPNRCTCGRIPVTRARSRPDGVIITQATCPRIECGAQGLEHLDDSRNDPAALDLWNRHGGRKAA